MIKYWYLISEGQTKINQIIKTQMVTKRPNQVVFRVQSCSCMGRRTQSYCCFKQSCTQCSKDRGSYCWCIQYISEVASWISNSWESILKYLTAFAWQIMKTMSNDEVVLENIQIEEVSVPKKWCFEWSVNLYVCMTAVFLFKLF